MSKLVNDGSSSDSTDSLRRGRKNQNWKVHSPVCRNTQTYCGMPKEPLRKKSCMGRLENSVQEAAAHRAERALAGKGKTRSAQRQARLIAEVIHRATEAVKAVPPLFCSDQKNEQSIRGTKGLGPTKVSLKATKDT